MKALLFSVALIATLNLGCISSMEDEVEVNASIESDDEYSGTLDQYTKNVKIIDEWATKYELTVTYLGEGFLGAFSNRYEKLYGVREPMLGEASDKTGFFVSIYSPHQKGYDLVDQELWKIFLDDSEGRKIRPAVIKNLSSKERWNPFFNGVNHWSREYLIVFDTNLIDPTTEGLVQKKQINLTFSNADAQVNVQW